MDGYNYRNSKNQILKNELKMICKIVRNIDVPFKTLTNNTIQWNLSKADMI